MKEIRYSAKIQDKQTLSDSKGIWPDINKLKDKFKEGSIPLQTDFNQLIDIADIGRKATGQAPNQNGPAQGMRLGEDGLLQLKLSENDENYVDGYHSPLILHKDVLGVGVSHGLITYQNSNEIGVNPGNGLRIDGDSVTVKLADNKGLAVDSNGIAIKPGNGIKVDADGVAIDLHEILPKGTIMMFYGTIPNGWAICDGSNNTPDLSNAMACQINSFNFFSSVAHINFYIKL
ncbi:hypothetical protein ACR71G_16425 [Xenorhabdus bovienii]|uniref:hypothetical protein n=1 Tax=Xenorhabdus bovienii TaxID=40576 RepID=UPI003DA2F4EF